MTVTRLLNSDLNTEEARVKTAENFLEFLTAGAPENTYLSLTEYLYSPDNEGHFVRSYFYPMKNLKHAAEMAVMFCDPGFRKVTFEKMATDKGKVPPHGEFISW